MQRPISLKIFGITTALLLLMVVVTWLSVFNMRRLNHEVKALSDYYLPLEQQVASVEILIRQQIVHMERLMGAMNLPHPDPKALEQESSLFDQRGINADQVIDSSLKLLAEARKLGKEQVDHPTLDLLDRQLPEIQTARQRLHAAFRQFQIESEEGNTRSLALVRRTLQQEKDSVDNEIQKTLDLLNQLTTDSAERAEQEENRATRLNWFVTGMATLLGLAFAAFVTRSLVEPVKRLVTGTQSVEKGDLDIEISVASKDEIAVLADSFNHMVAGLREKERIKETFGQYVDPRIIRVLLENQLPSDGGERRVMTVFFSDLQGFTSICERLTPDMTVRFLNRYFSLMAHAVQEHQGIVDKLIGDAIMAFWGPPFSDRQQQAELCCAAALAQREAMQTFRASLPELFGVRSGLPEVEVRMGIATGEVTVGNIGSENARGFTVIGDTTNLASRLETANKYYGTRILVSESTRAQAEGPFLFREIDSLRVIGKSEAVRAYELIGRKERIAAEAREWLRLVPLFEQGLAAYRQRDWDTATIFFQRCLEEIPQDPPSQVYLKRIDSLRQQPPAPDWDGIWVLPGK